MILFKRRTDLRNYLDAQRKTQAETGFVPTMGALHEGHISLLNEARQHNETVICSIFINPTQFNDPSDFNKYPVTLEKDIRLLEEVGCDILFLPTVEEIYPGGVDINVQHYDLGYLETILEGKYRPGHFQGVCRVVHYLLEIVKPGHLYLGQKDYQQCMVIRRLLDITGMNASVNIHIAPTLREKDGLAMSSRNTRLDPTTRQKANSIFEALDHIKKNIRAGDTGPLREKAIASLAAKGFRVDYVEIADAGYLRSVADWDGKQKIIALAAAFIGEVRLIDNMLLT